jgi:GNAT superfamily N-acetyltransferase
MDDILTDTSPAAMALAIEENLCELFKLWRNWSRAETHDGADLLWTMTDIPLSKFNITAHARLTPASADGAIQTLIQRSQVKGVALSWVVCPTDTPPDLGARLEAHGFLCDEITPGMAMDLHWLEENPSRAGSASLNGFSIERVKDDAALQTFSRVKCASNDSAKEEVQYTSEWLKGIGTLSDDGLRLYLGYLHGEPVATSMLLLGAGAAGIYCVATLQQARRRGIGAAMTVYPLQEARHLGYRVGCLQASEMGYSFYQKIGFQEYCQVGFYSRSD